jgi:dolichol-phosphate mannosyltransferase
MRSYSGQQKREVKLSVVVPCYNEQDSLEELQRRLNPVCHEQAEEAYEILLVNDGSKDSTWPMIRAMAEADPHIVGINLARNHGHQLALTAGLSVCRGERVLIIDADLQDPPELLGPMMALMDEGYDVVYGTREDRAGESWFKKASASLFYRLLGRLTDIEIPVDTGDFRLISRRALDVLNAMPEQHRFIRGMVSWIGFRQAPLRYERAARFAGRTKYSLAKMIRFALDAITGFSIRPLRLASWFGGLFGLVGLVVLIYVMGAWAAGSVVPGWTSLMVVVLILGSIQLFMVGLMGEYIGRLYVEAKRRPLFIIEDIVRAPSPGDPRGDRPDDEAGSADQAGRSISTRPSSA